MNQSFLEQSKDLRTTKFIAPEEATAEALKNHEARDVFSLGALVQHVLKEGVVDNEELLRYARDRLQAKVPCERPSFRDVLTQPFFSGQDFLSIVAFLTDLPLKSQQEKETFFKELTQRLFNVPEETVALQATSLLLSRYVMLNPTAKTEFLRDFLTPAQEPREPYSKLKKTNPILPESLFKEFVSPVLLKIFHVRDFSIRSALLTHFPAYCGSFRVNVLEDEILPQLLLGMRDTNDKMVASTLRALAELVPILGAKVVVGQHRRKVFTDGEPSQSRLKQSQQVEPQVRLMPRLLNNSQLRIKIVIFRLSRVLKENRRKVRRLRRCLRRDIRRLVPS